MASEVAVCIDPGLNCTGFALVLDRRVVADPRALRWGRPTQWGRFSQQQRVREMSQMVREALAPLVFDTLVLEWPQIYKGERGKDPNQLLWLAAINGAALGCAVDTAFLPHPREWKGQVPKDVHNRRVCSKLLPEVQAALDAIPKTYRHNAIDACGLGLWYIEQCKYITE